MRNHSWINVAAAHSRLEEIDREIAELQEEQSLLALLLGAPTRTAAARPASSGSPARGGSRRGPRGPRGPRTGPSLASLLADAMKGGPAEKAWTVGELIEAVRKTHPDRVAGDGASALVSATLAKAMQVKSPPFVARKVRGQRAKRYRLAA